MALRHLTAKSFWRSYDELPRTIQRRAEKQFFLLKDNPSHPSLQFKKVVERHGEELWSARVTLNYRALAIRRPTGYLWIWIGDHRAYEAILAG